MQRDVSNVRYWHRAACQIRFGSVPLLCQVKSELIQLIVRRGKIFALTLLPEMRELCTINLLTLSLTTANVPVI